MFAWERCSRAAACSRRSLNRGETRKLIAMVFSAAILCIAAYDTCNTMFQEGADSLLLHLVERTGQLILAVGEVDTTGAGVQPYYGCSTARLPCRAKVTSRGAASLGLGIGNSKLNTAVDPRFVGRLWRPLAGGACVRASCHVALPTEPIPRERFSRTPAGVRTIWNFYPTQATATTSPAWVPQSTLGS